MIESNLPKTWFDTDFATTKALIDSKVLSNDGSAESQAMLAVYDSLGTPLTGSVKDAMIAYVDADVASGNYALRDYQIIMSNALGGTNDLIDFRASKIATNNGAVQSVKGYVFAGAEWIDNGFNMLTDSTNYTQDDAGVSVYMQDLTYVGIEMPFGVLNGTERSQLFFPTAITAQARINSTGGSGDINTTYANGLYSIYRDGASSNGIYKDGAAEGTDTEPSTGVPNHSMFIGANFNNGLPAENFLTGTIAMLSIHSEVGFDHVADASNLNTLLTALGAL